MESTIWRARGADGEALGAIHADSAPGLATTSARPPGDAAVARYCSAAGEVMRVAPTGTQRQAQVYLQTALQKSRAAKLPVVTAMIAYRLGLVSVSGASVEGLRGGGEALPDARRLVGQLRAAEANNQGGGEVCAALADLKTGAAPDPAISMLALNCAARLALESGTPAISALASLQFARFALHWLNYADDPTELRRVAREKTLAAIGVAETVANDQLQIELTGRLALAAMQLGATDEGPLQLAANRLRGITARPEAISLADEIEARIALATGQRGRAKVLLEDAVLHESERSLPVRLPEIYLLLGEADPAVRQRHVATAFRTLENIRPRMPRLDPLTEESMFSLHMRRIFEAAADMQLRVADLDDRSDPIRTTQQIVEAFREAELQSAVGSECLPERSAVKPEELASGETLLYPLLFDDRVELIYVTGGAGTRQFHRLPPNRSTNRREVTELAQAIVVQLTRDPGDEWRKSASRLYDILIRPIEAHLSPNSTLAIIPDGPLRGVPFAALLARDGHYLVERTAVTVAPALAYAQPGDIRQSRHLNILAASLDRRVVVPAGSFPALAGTTTEARIAAANGSPGKLVENFTRAQLVAALEDDPIDVLHLATHAAFNGRSDRAFIVADGDVIRLSELREIIGKNRVRGDMLDLLVLSACETAVGDDEASMGLAGAAVQAGALSAIASLWQVDDAGTAELMRQFYSRFRNGDSRAEALREAQLSLLRGGGNNSDPYVWAAFTLLGAWR